MCHLMEFVDFFLKLVRCLSHLFCLFCEEHLASVPSSVENKKPESLSCNCPARQELSATRKRERRVTEGNMCGTQMQLYLLIFALTTRERGEEVGT